MPTRSPIGTIPGRPSDTRSRWVAGAAAGNITVTGIGANDYLVEVGGFKLSDGTPANLTSQFTITADNTINNTGGTATTGYVLYVRWVTRASGLG